MYYDRREVTQVAMLGGCLPNQRRNCSFSKLRLDNLAGGRVHNQTLTLNMFLVSCLPALFLFCSFIFSYVSKRVPSMQMSGEIEPAPVQKLDWIFQTFCNQKNLSIRILLFAWQENVCHALVSLMAITYY